MSAATVPVTYAPIWAAARALTPFALFGEQRAYTALNLTPPTLPSRRSTSAARRLGAP